MLDVGGRGSRSTERAVESDRFVRDRSQARTRRPEGIEQLVVLKTISPKHAENPKYVRMFLDEARLVASLDHPHIAKVFDSGQIDGRYFFTMEHIHGEDIRS